MQHKRRVNHRLAELPVCRCGKRGFPSAATAKRMASTMGNRVRVYLCELSKLWHQTDRGD
jgi:hypothetical protein